MTRALERSNGSPAGPTPPAPARLVLATEVYCGNARWESFGCAAPSRRERRGSAEQEAEARPAVWRAARWRERAARRGTRANRGRFFPPATAAHSDRRAAGSTPARTNPSPRGWRMSGLPRSWWAPLEGGTRSPVARLHVDRGVGTAGRNDASGCRVYADLLRRALSPGRPANAIDAGAAGRTRARAARRSPTRRRNSPTSSRAQAPQAAHCVPVAGLFSGTEMGNSAKACRALVRVLLVCVLSRSPARAALLAAGREGHAGTSSRGRRKRSYSVASPAPPMVSGATSPPAPSDRIAVAVRNPRLLHVDRMVEVDEVRQL